MSSAWIDHDEDESKEGGSPAPHPKHVAVGSHDRESKMATMNHMVATLQGLQLTRQLSGAVWWTVILPIALCADALETTRKHAELTKGKSGHKMGSPHVQLWRTLVKKLTATIESTGQLQSQLDVLKAYLVEFEKVGPDKGHLFVAQARLKQVKDGEKMILFYSLSTLMAPADRHATDTALHQCFESLKGEVKAGTAPPSEAEKKLQKKLDNLRTELGLKK